MRLRTRIVLIFAGTALLLTAIAAAPLWVLSELAETELVHERERALQLGVSAALNDFATPFEVQAAQLAADPALQAAAERADTDALTRLLAQAQARAPAAAVPLRLDVLTSNGRVLGSSAGMAAETPMLDVTNLRARVAQDPWLAGLEIGPDGRLWLVVTVGFTGGRFVSLAADVAPLLQAAALTETAATRRKLYLTDRRGRLLLATDAQTWPALEEAHARQGDWNLFLHQDQRTFSVISAPLVDAGGNQIATLVSVQDDTLAVQHRSLILLLTGGVAVFVFAVLLLGLYGFARGALDPLTELTRLIRAMAAGDPLVRADIPNRDDEIAAIARAVEVFRRDMVALSRIRVSATLRQAQQQALIRREMHRLADVLDERDRDALLAEMRATRTTAETDGDGTDLATAFRHMAARVTAQHGRLQDLLAERTRDLDTVRQALAERAQLSRLRQELEVARHLQLSGLPSVFPAFPGRTEFDLFAAMEPAKEVGGDFYDFALMGDRLAVLIGDASGKGVSAAIFVAMARTVLRSAIVRGATPAQAMALANNTLAVENHTMMFVTAFIGVLDLGTGRLTYANAGHNPPYLVGGGQVLPLGRTTGLAPGIALGVLDDAAYDDQEMPVPVGASLVLFTDGVTEAADRQDGFFGEDRLTEELAGAAGSTPATVVDRIQAAVRRFADGAEQADDITVLALRYDGAPPTATDAVQGVAGAMRLSVGTAL